MGSLASVKKASRQGKHALRQVLFDSDTQSDTRTDLHLIIVNAPCLALRLAATIPTASVALAKIWSCRQWL